MQTLQQRAEEAIRRLFEQSKTIQDMTDAELVATSERVSSEIKVLAMAIHVVGRTTATSRDEVMDKVLDLGRIEWEREERTHRKS